MTKTSTAAQTPAPATYAAVTLAHLERGTTITEKGDHAAYLALIEQSKTELDALGAGMLNQTPEARELQNARWAAQNAAQLEIVKAALAAGVSADAIMVITHRESM